MWTDLRLHDPPAKRNNRILEFKISLLKRACGRALRQTPHARARRRGGLATAGLDHAPGWPLPAGISRNRAPRPARFSISATRRGLQPKSPCSRSAGSVSTLPSCSPISSLCLMRSVRKSASSRTRGHGLIPSARSPISIALPTSCRLSVSTPVFETLDRVNSALPERNALLGFCGAPFTVASYMIAGKGTPDQAPARLAAYRDPAFVAALIERLVDASTAYLIRPDRCGRRGGADLRKFRGGPAAGALRAALPRSDRPHRRGRSKRRGRRRASIVFVRGGGAHLYRFAEAASAMRSRSTGARPRSHVSPGPADLPCDPGQPRSAGPDRRRRRRSQRRRHDPDGGPRPTAHLQPRPRHPAARRRRSTWPNSSRVSAARRA